MAKELFAMYCGLNMIGGMEEEKNKCSKLLSLARENEKLIVLIPINSDVEWVYGQCNFVHDPDHISAFKFSNTREALRDQDVIPALINAHGVDEVLFTDRVQYDWFTNEPGMRKYRDFFKLLKLEAGGYTRP